MTMYAAACMYGPLDKEWRSHTLPAFTTTSQPAVRYTLRYIYVDVDGKTVPYMTLWIPDGIGTETAIHHLMQAYFG